MNATNFIDGKWTPGSGLAFQSHDPFNQHVVWEGRASNEADIFAAIQAAQSAFNGWSCLKLDRRIDHLRAFGTKLQENQDRIAESISQETGKPLWEALGEAAAMVRKIDISVAAFKDRCRMTSSPFGNGMSVTRYKPHGVVAVFGPFNLPGHLPNGHIVPAILAGNTVVFKPSEMTPNVGQIVVELWERASLPPGVLNLVQGGKEAGVVLANQRELNGLFFTGSSTGGKEIHRVCAGHPEKILALEMGGNNPLIVHDIDDIDVAVYWTIQSAFITSGQRCVCARRLIITDNALNEEYIERLQHRLSDIRIGHYEDRPEPFVGPVISEVAATRVLEWQERLKALGGKPLATVETSNRSKSLLTPGLIDVTSIMERPDVEIFGPLLQLIRVRSLDAAIDEANNTAYGLSAGLFSRRLSDFELFLDRCRAGVANWNQPLTGASSAAPFGGIGQSGNHNPSAYFAADYCSYPVASIESDRLEMPKKLTPGIGTST